MRPIETRLTLRPELLAAIIAATLAIAGCNSGGGDNARADNQATDEAPDSTPGDTPGTNPGTDPGTDPGIDPGLPTDPPERGLFEPDPSDLQDVASVYQTDGYGTIDVLRMDVRTETAPGTCVAGEYSGCTLADIIADTDRRDDLKPRIAVHFNAPDYPQDGLVVNAEMRQRGGTTRKADQKSFRLRLEDKDALWRNERSIYVNKHPYESDRIRNKLAFDLMSEIPHLFSMRTQFANLWIDDGLGPVDYGLFTHVEAPGANYLRKRGIDKDDRLYKVSYFRFSASDLRNVEVDGDGKPLDEDRFETSLEIEAGKDHRMLVQMLTDFQDPARSFDSILDQYFNRNNVLTWMAVNFLMHQTDAVTHNYILYNPQGSEKFYFVPWDYDGGFVEELEPPVDSYANDDLQKRLYYGYARGINSEFHKRYYRLPGIHERIVGAADYLRENYLTDANIDDKAQLMGDVVEPYVSRLPDSEFNPTWNTYSVDAFARHVARNQEALRTRFSIPMPPKLADPVVKDGRWIFGWAPAYDPTGHSIEYELLVSSTLAFAPDDIELEIGGIEDRADRVEASTEVDRLSPGTHYVRITARVSSDPARYWQVASNRLVQDGRTNYGVVRFEAP